MAKQKGPHFITGTIGDVTFYQMEGAYYARKKSSLTPQRVKRSPNFVGTMRSAGELGAGSSLASKVYRQLPKDKKKLALFRKLTGIAIHLSKKGETEENIKAALAERVADMMPA